MGNTYSQPEKGKTLKVIGAGLSRTGTSSFGHAVSTLLDGPCYHGGTQLLSSPEAHINQWINVFEHTPINNEADRKFVLQNTKELLDGFVGCMDLPANCLVEELMEIYPDAIVICTVRDQDKWWASLGPIVEKGNLTVLSWILAPLPTLRRFRRYHDVLDEGRVGELYFKPGEPQRPTKAMYERHIAHLKKVVPKEKLHFFDVRDGWEPLCAILGKPVPKEPFPRLNDAQAIEDFMKWNVQKGLMAWATMFVAMGVSAWGGAKYMGVV